MIGSGGVDLEMRIQEVFKAPAEAFPITKGSLSHHFNALKAADLIRSERNGQQIVYALNTTVFEDVEAMMLDLFHIDGEKKR
jgi:DNA-binding transcriptional ArsR family regulator